MSAASASSRPPPSAKPLMAATVGNGSAASVLVTSWPLSAASRPPNASRSCFKAAMSAPATKARPAPVRTSARTLASASAISNANASSISRSWLSALSAFWRSMVTTAMSPSSSYRRCSKLRSSTSDWASSSWGASVGVPSVWGSWRSLMSSRRRAPSAPRAIVAVEPFAGLAPELAGAHHLLHERSGAELRIPELLEQRLRGRQSNVDADQVGELQRADGHVGAELHGAVDVLGRRHALGQRVHRVVDVGDEESVHDEPGLVLAHDRRLADAFGERARLLDGLLAAAQPPHDLDQRHHGHGVEEVHAAESFRAAAERRDLGDGQARGVGGQQRAFGRDGGDALPHVALDVDRLVHRLDHDPGVLQDFDALAR